ncbi:MAG: hypothetical protein ABFD08_09700 [Syntrophomonas sp.]
MIKDILRMSIALAQAINEKVEKETLMNEETILEKLRDLQLMLQDNQISEYEYEDSEAILIENLKILRKAQKGVHTNVPK